MRKKSAIERLGRVALPLAAIGGAGAAYHAGQKGEGMLSGAIPQAITAGSMLGAGTLLMTRKPFGLPVAKDISGLTNRFFEAGTVGAFAGVPAYLAGHAVHRQRQATQPQQPQMMPAQPMAFPKASATALKRWARGMAQEGHGHGEMFRRITRSGQRTGDPMLLSRMQQELANVMGSWPKHELKSVRHLTQPNAGFFTNTRMAGPRAALPKTSKWLRGGQNKWTKLPGGRRVPHGKTEAKSLSRAIDIEQRVGRPSKPTFITKKVKRKGQSNPTKKSSVDETAAEMQIYDLLARTAPGLSAQALARPVDLSDLLADRALTEARILAGTIAEDALDQPEHLSPAVQRALSEPSVLRSQLDELSRARRVLPRSGRATAHAASLPALTRMAQAREFGDAAEYEAARRDFLDIAALISAVDVMGGLSEASVAEDIADTAAKMGDRVLRRRANDAALSAALRRPVAGIGALLALAHVTNALGPDSTS